MYIYIYIIHRNVVLYKEVESIPSRIKAINHMLDIIDNLNDSDFS